MYRSHVLVCGGTGCTSSGSQQIMETLKEEIKKAGLEKEVVAIGVMSRVELWSDKAWQAYNDEATEDYESTLAKLAELGI